MDQKQYPPADQYQGQQPPPQYGAPPGQVTVVQVPPNPTGQFQHGLCGCFDNCSVCILTFIVPCWTFGKVAEGFGESCTMCGLIYCLAADLGVSWVLGAMVHQKLRTIRGIAGSTLGDICLSCWCGYCLLVQDYQEILAMQQGSQGQVVVTTVPIYGSSPLTQGQTTVIVRQ